MRASGIPSDPAVNGWVDARLREGHFIIRVPGEMVWLDGEVAFVDLGNKRAALMGILDAAKAPSGMGMAVDSYEEGKKSERTGGEHHEGGQGA